MGGREGHQSRVKILFAATAAEAFGELPESTKRRAANPVHLLKRVHIASIIPGVMRQA